MKKIVLRFFKLPLVVLCFLITVLGILGTLSGLFAIGGAFAEGNVLCGILFIFLFLFSPSVTYLGWVLVTKILDSL